MTPAQQAFTDLLAANVRRLSDRTGEYVGRMGDKDKEEVLRLALECATDNMKVFDPAKMNILNFWDSCLRDAMQSRKVWPRRIVGGWQYDYTPRILKSIPSIGIDK